MKQPLFSTSYAPRDGESTLDEIERILVPAGRHGGGHQMSNPDRNANLPRVGNERVSDPPAEAIENRSH